jgi:hypothetical protein
MAEEHAGEPWDEHAYKALFDGLGEGLDNAELTAALGRSVSSLSSIAKRLLAAVVTLDPDATLPGKGLDGLRVLITGESEQDWMPLAREAHKNIGQMFWGVAEDGHLTRAWEAHTETITAIASRLTTGDLIVVRRLVWLGLAHDRNEAIERLGVAPGSLLDVWQRLAAGNKVEQCVLTLSDRDGMILHVSIHANETDAREAIKPSADQVMNREDLFIVRWTLTRRVMGWDNAETFESDVIRREPEDAA